MRPPRRSPDNPCEGNAMTLSDHLRSAGTFLTSEEARARLLEEVHLRVHHRLIEELGPELSQGRLTAKDLRPRVNAHLQAALADETTPLSLADKARLGEGIVHVIPGSRPTAAAMEAPPVRRVVDKLVGGGTRRVDEERPVVHPRLPDGSRVNAVIH